MFLPRCSFRCGILYFLPKWFPFMMGMVKRRNRALKMCPNRVEIVQILSTSRRPRCNILKNLLSTSKNSRRRSFQRIKFPRMSSIYVFCLCAYVFRQYGMLFHINFIVFVVDDVYCTYLLLSISYSVFLYPIY